MIHFQVQRYRIPTSVPSHIPRELNPRQSGKGNVLKIYPVSGQMANEESIIVKQTTRYVVTGPSRQPSDSTDRGDADGLRICSRSERWRFLVVCDGFMLVGEWQGSGNSGDARFTRRITQQAV